MLRVKPGVWKKSVIIPGAGGEVPAPCDASAGPAYRVKAGKAPSPCAQPCSANSGGSGALAEN
jgi:hypothetical protein